LIFTNTKTIGLLLYAVTLLFCCHSLWAQKTPPPAKATPADALSFEQTVWGGFRILEDGLGILGLEGRLFIEVLVIYGENVEPGIFLLDISSPETLLLQSCFAEKLTKAELDSVSLKIGQSITLENIVPVMKEDSELRALAKRNASVIQGRTVCGVIGLPALLGRKVILDFAEWRLRFLPVEKPKEGDEQTPKKNPPRNQIGWTVPYLSSPGPFCCVATINGNGPYTLQISTACSGSWMKKEIAAKARWRKGKQPSSFLLGGAELKQIPIAMRFVELEAEDRDAAGAMPPSGIDGVLGNDFLSRFVVTLEMPKNTLHLKPIHPATPPEKRVKQEG